MKSRRTSHEQANGEPAGGYGGAVVLLGQTAAGADSVAFQAPLSLNTSTYEVRVRLADLNGDGKPDIILSGPGTNWAGVFLNTTAAGAATASFAPLQKVDVEADANGGVALADLNGDGKPDLISADFHGSLRQALGYSSGTLSSLAVGDVNGDGLPDLVVGNYLSSDAQPPYDSIVSVLRNLTPAGTTPPTETSPVFHVGAG